MLTRWLYFRLFGLTALIASGAYWWQLPGLASSRGVAPIAETVFWLQGRASFFDAPTVLWWSATDTMLNAVCAVCVLCAVLIVFDVAVVWALCGFFVAWVSLVNVGAPFLSFQWDILLCEAAFLSVFYALRPRHEPMLWQRLMPVIGAIAVTLESGIVKLTAGDASWWPELTALTFHYWTQPLPTWTSMWLDRLPLFVHRATCLVMFVLELGVPLLAFGPRRARFVAAGGMVALQCGLAFAGNYSYFNLVAAVLCVPLFDDALLTRWKRWRPRVEAISTGSAPRWFEVQGWVQLSWVMAASVCIFWQQYGGPNPFGLVQRFSLLNGYGAFRVMTKTRPEIVLEGSDDGVTWKPYEFRWKPGRVDRRPGFVAPWQPRLDWQMWFAALGDCGHSPWLHSTMRHLMLGTPEVLALMGENPFEGRPPKMIRSTVWQYRFAERGSTDWWARIEQGPFCPVVTLDATRRLIRAQ